MDFINRKTRRNHRKMEWRCSLLVILTLLPAVLSQDAQKTKINLDSNQCHNCSNSSNSTENFIDSVFGIISTFAEKNLIINNTLHSLEVEVESLLEKALDKDNYKIIEGVDVKRDGEKKTEDRTDLEESTGRALFSKYTYEYRVFQKVKNFIDTHVVSINLPKAVEFMRDRSFGLNKFLLPLFIGGQVIIKSILLAMFLPSILGSFGKILGKGISQLSASSSQASYPPINAEEPTSYNTDQKDIMGYETNQQGAYAYPDMYGTMDPNEGNELGNVDMSRFGATAQHMASKNSYYQNQMNSANNYKIFQKIPASSMILSNYDPFYSPLLSRLDGIFARLGLSPSENAISDGSMQIGGQSVHDVKLEGCREQLICLMYATPAKYAPYSNLVSAQLSRELNELRRPVSDNPEILRFFRYMRAARRGQESMDCMTAFPACSSNAGPAHTMIAAYHDINKLVTARKLNN